MYFEWVTGPFKPPFQLCFNCPFEFLDLSTLFSPHLPFAQKETYSGLYLSSSKKHFCQQQGACAAGLQTGCCLSWKAGVFVSSNLNQEILTNVPVHEEGNVCGFLTNLKSFITLANNKLTMSPILPKGKA